MRREVCYSACLATVGGNQPKAPHESQTARQGGPRTAAIETPHFHLHERLTTSVSLETVAKDHAQTAKLKGWEPVRMSPSQCAGPKGSFNFK